MPRGDVDPDSPTAKIQAFLAARGLQPTSQNVRAALDANANDPGYISGLRNQDPPAETPSVGRSGNVAKRIEQEPPGSTGGPERPYGESNRSTTAPTVTLPPRDPVSSPIDMGFGPEIAGGPTSTGAAILAALGLAGGGAGLYGLSRYAQGGAAPATNLAAQPTPATTATIDATAAPAPEPPTTGNRYTPAEAPVVSNTEVIPTTVMDKAVAPPAGVPVGQTGMTAEPPPRPPVNLPSGGDNVVPMIPGPLKKAPVGPVTRIRPQLRLW